MAAINSRSLGDRRAYTGCLRESRDADSAFCGEEETFTTRGKSTIRSISREERYAFAIKTRREYQPVLGFSLLGERGREGEIDQGQRSGRRDSLVC